MALCVISKEKQGETYPHHDIQSNSVWSENPYPDSYVIVPEDLVDLIRATRGFCDIVLNEDGTEVYDFSKLEIPEIPEPEEKPSLEEEVAELKAQNEMLMNCLLEMSEYVYA